jgi:hypothetical protein
MKEKMLMKLEKDRLIAKVENLEVTLQQNQEEQKDMLEDGSKRQGSKEESKDA